MSPRVARWETRSWPLFSPSVINPASWPGYGDWVSRTDPIDKSPGIVPPLALHRSGAGLCIHWCIIPSCGRSDREFEGPVHGLCYHSNPLTPLCLLVTLLVWFWVPLSPQDIVTKLSRLWRFLQVLQVELWHLKSVCMGNVPVIKGVGVVEEVVVSNSLSTNNKTELKSDNKL